MQQNKGSLEETKKKKKKKKNPPKMKTEITERMRSVWSVEEKRIMVT